MQWTNIFSYSLIILSLFTCNHNTYNWNLKFFGYFKWKQNWWNKKLKEGKFVGSLEWLEKAKELRISADCILFYENNVEK